MVQRIATMTVIRGGGECQTVINGVVSRELERIQTEQREKLNAERETLRREYDDLVGKSGMVLNSRNKLLAQRLTEIEDRISSDKSNRFSRAYIMAWSYLFAVGYAVRNFVHLFVYREV